MTTDKTSTLEEKERKEKFVNALTICCEKMCELIEKYNDIIEILENTVNDIVEVDFALREAHAWVIDAEGHCLSFDFGTIERELLTLITDDYQKFTNAIILLRDIKDKFLDIKDICCRGLEEAKRRLEMS